MSKSYIEQKTDLMTRLLWENILQELFESWLVTLPFLGWPVIRNVVVWFVENYLVEKLFKIATRWGVFTSIDWQNEKVHKEYSKQADKLIAAQNVGEWDPDDRKKFKEAARNLIRFNLRK